MNPPTLLVFGANYCGPTTHAWPMAKDRVGQAKDIIDIEYVDIETEEGKEDVRRYKIEGTPTFIMLNSRGQEIDRITGYAKHEDLDNMLRRAIT